MPYIPDPTLVTQPLDNVDASTAAAEFRAIKVYMAGLAGVSIIKPSQFSDPGDPVGDDSPKLQRFWDFVTTQNNIYVDMTGDFTLGSQVIIGQNVIPPGTNPNTKVIFGEAIYRAKVGSSGNILLVINNLDSYNIQGDITVIGTGSYVYSTRTWEVGIAFKGNNSFTRIGGLFTRYFKHHGVMLQTDVLSAGGFNEFMNISRIFGDGCGSGYTQDLTYSLISNYSNLVDSGSTGSFDQRTTINVSTLPPTFLDSAYGAIGTNQTYITLNGQAYHITAIDRINSKITVFPHVIDSPATGVLIYVYGAGLYSAGVNSNVYEIEMLAVVASGVGFGCNGLYPGHIGVGVFQNVGAAMIFGSPQTACQFSGMDTFYDELVDHSLILASIGESGYGIIDSIPALSVNKVRFMSPNLFLGGVNRPNTDAFRFFKMPYRGEVPLYHKKPSNYDVTIGAANLEVGASYGVAIQTWNTDNFFVAIQSYDALRDKFWGQNSSLLLFTGSGVNKQPTGTIQLLAPLGKSVNGIANPTTLNFTSLTGPLLLLITADPLTGNFTAVKII